MRLLIVLALLGAACGKYLRTIKYKNSFKKNYVLKIFILRNGNIQI